MTWDPTVTNVMAVAVVGDDMSFRDKLALSNLKGQTLQSSGLALTSVNAGGGCYAMPPMFNLPPMFGGSEPAASAADVVPPAAEN